MVFTNEITIPNDLVSQGHAIYKIMLWPPGLLWVIFFSCSRFDFWPAIYLAQIFQNSVYMCAIIDSWWSIYFVTIGSPGYVQIFIRWEGPNTYYGFFWGGVQMECFVKISTYGCCERFNSLRCWGFLQIKSQIWLRHMQSFLSGTPGSNAIKSLKQQILRC